MINKRKEAIMKQSMMLSISGGEDVLDFTKKLMALGTIVHELSFQNEGIFGSVGETLGSIVLDYASALNDFAEKAYLAIDAFYAEGGGTLSYELKRELQNIRRMPQCEYRIERINKNLEKAESEFSEAETIVKLCKELSRERDNINKAIGRSEQNDSGGTDSITSTKEPEESKFRKAS
ncbi:MAG: hypothetical protein C4522_02735 [Desulfobacteraceae bacterium]|nr:MAG: hypothetical protein C4522_02735 [Desulfobacteraceae bacterium]